MDYFVSRIVAGFVLASSAVHINNIIWGPAASRKQGNRTITQA